MDDSPVFPKDRRLAEAWSAGGAEAEMEMRETIRREEAETRVRHRKEFDDMINKARADAAAQQQAEEDEEEEAILQSVEEKYVGEEMASKCDDSVLSSENNMDEDQDAPAIEKLTSEARKRDASALELQECPSLRRHWRGVEFIGTNIEIQGASPIDEHIDLEATARYIEQNPDSICPEASSILLDDTMSETHNSTKSKSYSGLATLMGDSQGLLELSAVEKPSCEESDFGPTASENLDRNSETAFDWEAYVTAVPKQEDKHRISVQQSEHQFQCAERERASECELRERILRRVVVYADAVVETEKKRTKTGSVSISLDNEGLQSLRPIIWGTEAYRNIWAKAAEAAEAVESDVKSESSIEEKICDQEDHDISERTNILMDSLLSANMFDTDGDV